MTGTTGTKTAGRVRTETGRKRVRAYLGGELVADTRQPVLVWEWPYFPVYYFPAADVRAELVEAGDRALAEPGDAQLYHVRVPGATAKRAARRYPDSPSRPCAAWSGWTGMRSASGSRKTSRSTPTRATPTPGWTSWPAPGMSGSRWTG